LRRRQLEADADQQREQGRDEQQRLVAPPEEGDPQLVAEQPEISPNGCG
jgi:hypothetical protein